jgi:hypothetical protein
MIEGMLKEVGNLPTPLPKSKWAPQLKPLPRSLEAQQPAAAAPGPAGSPGGAKPAAAAVSGSSVCQLRWSGLVLPLAAVFAAALLL